MQDSNLNLLFKDKKIISIKLIQNLEPTHAFFFVTFVCACVFFFFFFFLNCAIQYIKQSILWICWLTAKKYSLIYQNLHCHDRVQCISA